MVKKVNFRPCSVHSKMAKKKFGVYRVLEKNSSFIRNISLCNIFQVFTDTFDQFNATLLNKSINFFKNILRVIIWLYGPQNLPKHWAIEQCYGQKQKVFFHYIHLLFFKASAYSVPPLLLNSGNVCGCGSWLAVTRAFCILIRLSSIWSQRAVEIWKQHEVEYSLSNNSFL